jgi:hypothetical protein
MRNKEVLQQDTTRYLYHYPSERTEFNIDESMAERIYEIIKKAATDTQKLIDLLTGLILLSARNSVLISPRELAMILQFTDDARVTNCFMSLINENNYLRANDLTTIIATLMRTDRYTQQLVKSQVYPESTKDENSSNKIISIARFDLEPLPNLVIKMINTAATIGDKGNFASNMLYRYFRDIARVAADDYFKQFCQTRDHENFQYLWENTSENCLNELAKIASKYLTETNAVIKNVQVVPIDIRVLLYQIMIFGIEQSQEKPDETTHQFQSQQIPSSVLSILAEVLVFGILGRFIMNYREKLYNNMKEMNNLLFDFESPHEDITVTRDTKIRVDNFNIKISLEYLFSERNPFYHEFKKLKLIGALRRKFDDKSKVKQLGDKKSDEWLSLDYFFGLLTDSEWEEDWLLLGKMFSQDEIKHKIPFKKNYTIPGDQAFILFVLVNKMFDPSDFLSTLISFIIQTLQKPQLLATAAIRGDNDSSNQIIPNHIYNNVIKIFGNQNFAQICLTLADVSNKEVEEYFVKDISTGQSNPTDLHCIERMQEARKIVCEAIFRDTTESKNKDNCMALAYTFYEAIITDDLVLLDEVKRHIRMLAASLERPVEELYARVFYLYKIKKIEINRIPENDLNLINLCQKHKYFKLEYQLTPIKSKIDETYRGMGCWCDVYLKSQLPLKDDLKNYHNTCILTQAPPMLTYVTVNGECEYFQIDSGAFSKLLKNIGSVDESMPLQKTSKDQLPEVWNLITSNLGHIPHVDKIPLRSQSDPSVHASSTRSSVKIAKVLGFASFPPTGATSDNNPKLNIPRPPQLSERSKGKLPSFEGEDSPKSSSSTPIPSSSSSKHLKSSSRFLGRKSSLDPSQIPQPSTSDPKKLSRTASKSL